MFKSVGLSERGLLMVGRLILAASMSNGRMSAVAAAGEVRWCSLRWQAEQFFKELKSDLGLARYGFREFDKISRWVDVILSAFTYLEWTRRQMLQPRSLAQDSRRKWTHQRTHGLCLAVRQESEQADLQALSNHLQTLGGLRSTKRTLRQALQAEARPAI